MGYRKPLGSSERPSSHLSQSIKTIKILLVPGRLSVRQRPPLESELDFDTNPNPSPSHGQMTRVWRGLGPDSGFGFGYFPEFGFGSVSALRVRIWIGSAGPGSDSDRFRRARLGFGSDPPPQVWIRIGYRFGSDSASEPGAWYRCSTIFFAALTFTCLFSG